MHTNAFISHIAESKFTSFHYKSLKGEDLKAWLLLPRITGRIRSYPLLTVVYPGRIQTNRPPRILGSLESNSVLNMQIAAAEGYAVLFPSMPLSEIGVADDPMLRLSEGVLPAVDKATGNRRC